jgi:hypothetical protein
MEVIEFGKKNYCVLVGKIKLDIDLSPIITRLKNCKPENFTFNNETQLWFYNNYKTTHRLIDLLYPNNKSQDFEFINNNINDYREKNIKFTSKNKYSELFPDPLGYSILEYGIPHQIEGGRYSNEYRNMYWKVKDNNNSIYYLMHIKQDVYTKISLSDIDKVININGLRPSWYNNLNGYIATNTQKTNNFYYLHQLIMDVHKEDLSSYEKTVDHINRDKLDNRRENLRFATMSEQNVNREKQTRRSDAIDLPEGISQSDLPKYVVYRKEILDKESNKFREYFYICNHPNCERWETSKSRKYSNYEKLLMAIKKLKELNEESSSDLESDTEDEKIIMPKYISYTMFRDQPHLIFDRRLNDKRYNLKMLVKPNDLQLELNLFIDKINDKYPELVMEKIILNNNSNINTETPSEILVDAPIETLDELLIETPSELSVGVPVETPTELQVGVPVENNTNIINNFSELKVKLPKNFTFFNEKEAYYIQFSKTIDGNRISKKVIINTNNIQNKLDELIDFLNLNNSELKLDKYIIPNLPIIKVFNESITVQKPKLLTNFSIPTVNNVDYIQFCKKIDGERIQYKTKINSYDLQSEINNFITYLNTNHNLNLNQSDYIIQLTDWKTSNKIIDHDNVTPQQLKNREKVLKSLAKKKEELGEDKVREMKTEYMKTYREKKLSN